MLPVNGRKTLERWETSPLAIPPRSRLYHMEPVGIGTPYVESLTGIIARLAAVHHNSTAILFGQMLAPLACKEYLRRAALRSKYQCRLLASAFRPLARAMNGTGIGASEWVQILQSLTLRTDLRFLTMLSWREVLPQGALLRPMRAWCPACYEEWHKQETIIYEPLLWAIKAVTVCPHHCEPLRTVCNYCKKTLHLLDSRSRPGYCSVCEIWLGEATGTGESSDKRQATEEKKRQIWAAKAVGELLAIAPILVSLPTREGILKSSSEHLKRHIGKLPTLARALRINKTTIWHWYKGENLPQLESLLKLCYQLDISLLDFMTGKVIGKCSVTATVSLPQEKEIQRPPRQHRALDKEEAEQLLQDALKETPASSLQDVAARLGRDANTLRYRFKDLCRAIVTRYVEYKKVCTVKSWEETELALRMVLDEEGHPSMAEVARRLGYDIKTLTKHYPDLCRKISSRHAEGRKTHWAEIKAILQAALTEYPSPSVLSVAKRLGLSQSSLYEHCPSLCHEIAKRYVSHRYRC